MSEEKRLIKRKIHRGRKSRQDLTAPFIESAFLIAGGMAATICFCIDLYKGEVDLISVGGLFLSIVSGATGYHLLEKANRGK